jgi:hypothetical protein
MIINNEPRISQELSLRKIAVITTVFAVIITSGIFIYTNISSRTDSKAGTQSTAGFTCYGPAGIGDNATNRFCYDLDSQSYSNGDQISAVINIGGNGASWTQSSSSQRPIYHTGADAMNGHAVIQFDGTDDCLKMADQSDLNTGASTERTYIVVFRTSSDITSRQVIYEEGGATRGLNIYLYNSKVYIAGWNFANDGNDAPWSYSYVDSTVNTETEYIVTMVYNGSTDNTTSGSITGYLNGALMGSVGNVGKLYAHGDDIGLGYMNRNSYFENGKGNGSGNYFEGEIATFIEYNYDLGDAQRQILENSLSSKFGISIANDLYGHESGGFDHNVAGIGKLGTDQNTCAASGSLIQISNPTDLDSGEFLLFGHSLDSGSNGSNNPNGIESRWMRQVQFEETGDVGDVDVTLSLDQTEFIINEADDIRLLVDTDGDGDMSNASVYTGVHDVTDNTIIFSGVSVTDDVSFTVGSTSSLNSLPVEFLYVKANLEGDRTRLSWATAMELNNSHFEIERSLDGRDFEYLDEELGNGNSNNIIKYEYWDDYLPSNTKMIYYRLKQVDFDGAFEYSPVVFVSNEDGATQMRIYPNPASDHVSVSKPGYDFDVQILNQGGIVVAQKTGQQDQAQLDLTNVPSGMYIISVITEAEKESKQLIIRH